MWVFLVVSVLCGAQPGVEVRTAQGESFSGTLAELDNHRLAIHTAKGQVGWKLSQLTRVVLSGTSEPTNPPAVSVELIDGTQIAGESVTTESGKARIKLADSQLIEVPTDNIHWLRFVPPSDALAAQWSKIVADPSTADILVVRTGDGIDYHKGILRRVSDDTIEFELEGERLPVRRAKVFGLVYHHSSGRDLAESAGTLVDRSGSTWTFRTIALTGDQVEWTTVLGQTLRRPVSALLRLDFSHDKVLYLSDLKPDSIDWVPYFGLGKELSSRVALYSPRQDQNLEAGPLQVDGKRFAKGVSLHSRTTIVYRLPDRYRRFVAVAGIDDSARPQGNVRLTIRGDDRPLFEGSVTGVEGAKTLDVDVTGVRRLTILADFGDDFDVGDHLDLCDARLLK